MNEKIYLKIIIILLIILIVEFGFYIYTQRYVLVAKDRFMYKLDRFTGQVQYTVADEWRNTTGW